jgi:hypothetical protein
LFVSWQGLRFFLVAAMIRWLCAAFYSVHVKVALRRLKRQEREVVQPSQYIAFIKSAWNYTPTPSYMVLNYNLSTDGNVAQT